MKVKNEKLTRMSPPQKNNIYFGGTGDVPLIFQHIHMCNTFSFFVFVHTCAHELCYTPLLFWVLLCFYFGLLFTFQTRTSRSIHINLITFYVSCLPVTIHIVVQYQGTSILLHELAFVWELAAVYVMPPYSAVQWLLYYMIPMPTHKIKASMRAGENIETLARTSR